MSSVVISVENLSKRYTLGAGGRSNEGYTALRDVIARGAAAPFKRLKEKLESRKTAPSSPLSTSSFPLSTLAHNSSPEEFWALKDVSFDIKQGEVVGIIGRNGAGKSTLLKILSRITDPTEGKIKIKGRVASLLEVGTGFHPELTGRENIYLNGAILGMSRAEIKAKFDEIVAFAEVEKFLDTPVKRYSSGMYVRLAFAVAAHLEPEILIVDEVLAVGDAEFQKKCLGKMQDVAGHGRTVIFVSHNLAAITTLTNKCLYLEKGNVRFIGKTSDAINFYSGTGLSDDFVYRDDKTSLNNKPLIRSIELNTSLPGNIHINGMPLEILVTLETAMSIDRACLSIQIFDSDQINYAHVWYHDLRLQPESGNGRYLLKCSVPRLRLYLGKYRVRAFFSEPPGGQSFQILDGICPFEVVMPDNSRLFQWWPKECAYLEECNWSFQAIDHE